MNSYSSQGEDRVSAFQVFRFQGFCVFVFRTLRYTQVNADTLKHTQEYQIKALRGLEKFSGGWSTK